MNWMGVTGCFLGGVGVGAVWTVLWFARRRKRDGRFLSFVAHEMNSPLASLNMTILNFVQGVFGPLSKDHEPWIHLLKEQSARLNFLVGGFQDLIHMEYHKDFHLHPESLNLSALLRETIEEMRGSLERSSAKVVLSTGSDAAIVQGDRDRLQRVLANILEHAKKFRTKGEVKLSLKQADGAVLLEADYEGPKIAPADVARMLTVYYPVDRSDPQLLPCVGLGLGMCRALVEAHGGSMTMDVDDNGLSRIKLSLPLGS